jgi:hypothetical protein
MRRFSNPPAALNYIVDALIPKEIGYIVNVVGPAEDFTGHAATVQIVDQNKVYGDGELGLVLHLPFDPSSATHESFEMFKSFAKKVAFDDVTYDGIPCFAINFGTNLKLALHTLAVVLNEVHEYPELTSFNCEVYEG